MQQQNAQNWSHNKGLFFFQNRPKLKCYFKRNKNKKQKEKERAEHKLEPHCSLLVHTGRERLDGTSQYGAIWKPHHVDFILACFCVFRHLLMRCKCTHRVDAWPTPNEHAYEPSLTPPQRVTTVGHACLFTPHTQMAPHGDAERWKEVEEFTSSIKSGKNNNLKNDMSEHVNESRV